MTTTSATSSTTSSASTASGATVASTTTTAADGTQTTSSTGSSILTSLGVGTGIDMTNLATEIATATYANQVTNVTGQLTAVTNEISMAGTLQSDWSSLVSSMSSLVNGGTLSSTPTVTNSSVATASLPSGATAPTQGYSLEVDKLAQGQVLASQTFSSSAATTGSGTLSIQLGTMTNGTFTAGSASAVSVTVNQGDSLSTIASEISSSGTGISAYVVTNANGAQLVMKGPTGAASAFTITASENSADPGLSALNYPPTNSTGTTVAQSAQDASFSVDGIAQTSSSNTIQNVAPGLSLSLTGTNVGAPTTITYSNPSSAISTAMTNLTSALNQMVGVMNTDMTASSTGSLINDPGAQAFQQQLSTLASTTIMPSAAAGAPSTLADLGLTLNKDGTFTFNSATFSTAMTNNSAAVSAMFTNGLYGVYGTLFNIQSSITSSTDPGSLAGSVTYYTNQQTALNTQKSTIASEQSALQTQLVTQLAAANTAVAASKSTMSFLTQQIAQWDGTSSSSG